jgi:hypothetical protein
MRTLLTAAFVVIGLALAACATASVPAPSPSPLPLESAPGSGEPSGSRPSIVVALAQAPGNDVAIEVIDASGLLVDASSGSPGDGASVEPYTVAATNLDPTTVRLTWVDGPCDSRSTLTIDATASRILIVQPECSGDAVAYDRVLELWFSRAVDAERIEVSLQDGLDSAHWTFTDDRPISTKRGRLVGITL